MDERLDFSRFFSVVQRHRRSFGIVALVAVVASVIISGPTFMVPRYRSTAIVYPVNLNSYSIETRADQLLQLLQSNIIRDSVINTFGLVDHYRIDTASTGGRSALYNMYMERVEINKTRYESVEIDVEDEDPLLARNMVNAVLDQCNMLARRLQQGDSREVLTIMRNSMSALRGRQDSVEAKLNRLRSDNGLLDYKTQTKELTKAYLQLLNKGGSQAQKDQVLAMLKELEVKGGEYHGLDELNDRYIEEYGVQAADYQKVLTDVSKELTYTNVVVYPEVSDKKVYPVRWLVVLVSLVSALFLCYLFVALREQRRTSLAAPR